MHIFKQWPIVENACSPTNINWENLGYSGKNRFFRRVINWCIAILFILLALIGIAVAKT
jgi:hypothetical protein